MKFRCALLLVLLVPAACSDLPASAVSPPTKTTPSPKPYNHSPEGHNHSPDNTDYSPDNSPDNSPDHDDHDSEMTPIPHLMHHAHGTPILNTHLEPAEKLFWDNYNTTTYFTVESAHKPALYVHIVLMVASFVFLYPLVLVANNIRSTAYLPLLSLHAVAVLVSLLNYSRFIASVPVLYPGNAYNKMSWILAFSTISHWFFALLAAGYNHFVPTASPRASNDYFAIAPDEESDYDVETNASASPSPSPPLDHPRTTSSSDSSFELTNMYLKSSPQPYPHPNTQNRFTAWLVNLRPVQKSVSLCGKSSVYISSILNWAHFFYFLVYAPTMVATFLILGQGKAVFNLLAHFIKGGVFFSLGLLYLARYCGAFSNKGWAWNHKFITSDQNPQSLSKFDRLWNSKGCWTMELIESSLILFYGCTNVFLEHLSNAGGEWSAKDLQHASIAFIYIGCGFCGVLTEVKLNNWRFDKAKTNHETIHPNSVSHILKATPGFSPNPFPVLTIYWTGVIMSKHQQASPLSTAIHIQWGNLFVLACAFRFLTYVLALISPPNKNLTQPGRPFTELLATFSLLCGGLIFMESTDPVIYCFEYHGFTEMFTLDLSLGFVALLMGWEMGVFALKDWLLARRNIKN